jgi:hypothetical protein
MTGGPGLAGYAGSRPHLKWSTFRFPKVVHFSVPVDKAH